MLGFRRSMFGGWLWGSLFFFLNLNFKRVARYSNSNISRRCSMLGFRRFMFGCCPGFPFLFFEFEFRILKRREIFKFKYLAPFQNSKFNVRYSFFENGREIFKFKCLVTALRTGYAIRVVRPRFEKKGRETDRFHTLNHSRKREKGKGKWTRRP